MSLVDFFGHSVTGSFSDAACEHGFELGLTTSVIVYSELCSQRQLCCQCDLSKKYGSVGWLMALVL